MRFLFQLLPLKQHIKNTSSKYSNEGEVEVDVDVELEVEVAACVMGELAGQLSVFDDSEMRSYCVIQLCILLRLLAGMLFNVTIVLFFNIYNRICIPIYISSIDVSVKDRIIRTYVLTM